MWLFKSKNHHFKALINELTSFLEENQIQPSSYFYSEKILEYITFFPFNQIYYFLRKNSSNIFLKKEEREFVFFLRKFSMIKSKQVNLLLDTPMEFECEYREPIGRRRNLSYNEELINYKEKLRKFENLKKENAEKKRRLVQHPLFDIYKYVYNELDSTQCIKCQGTGIIPSIFREPGFMCFACNGDGRNNYSPKITKQQISQFLEFKTLMEEISEPTFLNFPQKYISVYIRVIHGGQIFLFEK